MQKNHAPDSSLYWYMLTEMEWYGVDEAARNALAGQCKAEANDLGARYANIMVEPDAVMSISPNPRRHIVWRAAAAHPTMDLDATIADLCTRAEKAGLSAHEIHDVLVKYAEMYADA